MADNKRRRRRKTLRISALLGAIVLGNGPIIASYASNKYQDWKEHQPSYERRLGRWDVVADSHTRSVHAAMLDTGQVLLMAGSGNDQASFDSKTFRTMLWDPVRNTFTKVTTPWDVFCAGHTFLSTGQLLIAGGTSKYEVLAQNSPDGKKHEYEGVRDSFLYDPTTSRFVRTGYLNDARWYPTLTKANNGTVIAVSGLDQNGNINDGTPESYDAAKGVWVAHPGLHHVFPTYPALQLTAGGQMFFSGANSGYGPGATNLRKPGLWNLQTNKFTPITGLPQPDLNETAATLLLPPAQDQRYMFIGGGGVGDSQLSTGRTAIVDFNAKNPAYVPGPSLAVGKRYPGAVILPDDTVLVAGGSKGYRRKDTRTAQIYNVAANSFSGAASPHVGRDYHSEYILLPDGRVAVFGSNPLSDSNTFETRVEVYSPGYLFKGPRPKITAAPKTAARGRTLTLSVAGGDVAKVRLIAPGAYTHVTDNDQRSVALPIVAHTGDQVTVTVPPNANVTPSGQYMLFVDNAAGIPSVASWVHLQ